MKMKKLQLLLAAMLLVVGIANAQVSSLVNPTYGYTFLNTTSTFTSLGTGGTVFQTGTAINTNGVSGAITLPFAFTYNGIKENTIYISNNGFITFALAPTTTQYSPISSTTSSGYDGVISGFAVNCVASTAVGAVPEIRYGTNGGGDFVVQFQDLGQSVAAGARVTFQIILKTTGVIQIVYGPNNIGFSGASQVQVGLRGTNDEDWNNRTLASGGNWNTAGGASGTVAQAMSYTATTTVPTSGRTFQWSPTSYTPTYLTNPGGVYQEFTTWVNGAGPANIPSSNWAANGYGNASWQIDNTTVSTTGSGWTGTASNGIYSPVDYASASGGHSARFHSYQSDAPQVGYLDYYVDMSTITGTPTLDFYHINTSGTDILKVFLSTDGGSTFSQIGSNIGVSAAWTAKSISLGSTNSATTIVRFKGTSDFGSTDIGIDHVVITPPPALPTISGYSPTPNLCANGGQTVTITGTNFTGTSSVKFNAVNAVSFTVVSSTSITAVTPSGLTAGTIEVTNPAGTANSSSYTVVSNPTVTVSPTTNSLCVPGATAVALTGSGASTYSWGPSSGLDATTGASVNALPSSSTTYTVTGTDANGCTATSTSVFTVTAGVSATASASPLNVCSGANSQLDVTSTQISTNTIGTGVSTSSSTAASFFPGSWGGAKTQYIILASELTAKGMVAGNLKSIAFEPTTAGQTYRGFFVNIGSTTSTSMTTSFITTGLTEVYAGTLTDNGFLPVANTVNTLTFGTGGAASSFYWDGTSNLVVSISWSSVPNASTATSSTMKVDAPGFTCSAYDQQDNVTPAVMKASTTADGTGTSRPKFIFTEDILLSPTYAWTESPSTTLSSTSIANPMSNGITATNNYTVTVTGSGGCTATSTLTVNVASSIVCSPITSSNGTSLCIGQNTTLTASATIGGTPYSYVWTADPSLSATNIANPIATPTATTTYTCTVTDACGTTCSTTITINVNSLPTVGVSPSSSNICNPGGTAVSLTASGTATGYSWLPASGLSATSGTSVTALPSATTTYTITGTDANGCSATTTTSVSINLYPVLTAISATPATVCSNGTSDLLVVPQTTTTAAGMNFSATTGASLETMTSSTVVTAITTGSLDDGFMTVTPSGFTFPYLGTNVTTFNVGTNGYVILGATTPSSTIPSSLTTHAGFNGIYAFGRDGNLNTTNSGNLTHGPAAGDKYVFEMNKYSGGGSGAESSSIYATYQIVLWGTASADPGKIEVIYGTNAGTPATSGTIGIRDAANTFINGVNGSTSLTTTASAWPSSGQKYTYSLAAAPTYSWAPATFLNSTTVANPQASSITASTIYTVTATSNGCSTTSSVSVDLAGSVVCSPITSSNGSTLCVGQNTTLTASATIGGTPYVYSWTADPSLSATNIANPVATPTATTTYTVTVTDACLTTCSTTITITVNPLPATVTVSGAGTFCSNTTITANNGGDGTIYFQGTTSGGTSTAIPSTSESITSSGTYYFRALSTAGCWGPEGSAVVVIQTPAGISTTPVTICQNSASSSLAATATNCSGFVNSGTTLAGTFAPSTDLTALRPTTSIVNSSTCSFDASITRNYQLVKFQVSVSGTYTFDMTSTDDGMAYITTDGFVPGSCSGGGSWIKGDDDSGPGNDPQLSMTLTTGVTYNLVSTTYSSSTGTSSAAYSWTITPPSGGQLMLPTAGNLEWYTSSTGGTSIGTGASFDPVGAAGSGLSNTNTGGTTTYYVACSYSPVCRSSVDFTITTLSQDISLSTSGNASSTIGNECKTQTQVNNSTLTYSNTSCNAMVQIADNAAGTGLGSTDVCANVVASNPIGNNGQVYAPRYVQITPSTSEAADVTLYFTQADFTSYNAANGSLLDFPTSASDPNIANVIIAQVSGGTLATGTVSSITPTSVTWDATNSKWSVVFPTTALGGYYYAFSNPSCNYAMPAATVSNITPTTAQFDWTSAGAGLTYDWRYRVQGATSWTNAGTGTSAVTRVFTGLASNTTYEFQGKVRCGAGLSGLYGSTVTFTTAMQPCSTPTGLAYSALTSSSVTLSWTAMSAPVTSYVLRYRIVGSGIWMNAGVATSSKTISGLTPSSNYEAQIASYCSASGTLTAYSTSLTFTTSTGCPVTTNLAYSNATSNSVQLNWDAMGSPVTSYVLSYRIVGSGTWLNAGVSTNTKTLYGLTSGANYEAIVKSYCAASGTLTAASNTVTFTTSASCPLTNNITANGVTTTQASLIWADVSSATSGNKYVLRYRVNPSGSWINAGCPTYLKTIYGLSANTSYDVQVQTVCAGGALSAFTDTYTFATPSSKPEDVIETTLESATTFAVYPNPTSDVINIDFYATDNQSTMVKVYDLTGRLMKQVSRQSTKGNNSIDVNLGEFANGVYTIQVYENNSLTHTTRVRKNN